MISASEAARRLGLKPQTVARLCKAGLVPGAIPPQREWQIPEDSLDRIPVRRRGRQSRHE